MNLSSETTSRLFKLCSLLWYHLQRIYGTHDIFDSHHHHKPLIISLIKKVGLWYLHFDNKFGEFCSHRLSSFLIKLYKEENDLNHLNLITEILITKNPDNAKKILTNIYKKSFTNFSELSPFFTDLAEEVNSCNACNFKAYAELESYL
jgi:hypothetical protein